MAVLKNFKNDELIVSCKCGCNDGIHIKINKKEDETDRAFIAFTNGNFYREQGSSFIKKLQKIWAIIANKDFYYSDIVMTEKDFKEFTNWVVSKGKMSSMDMVENMLTEIGNIYPDREIIIETNNGSVSTKLSKANIFVDGDGNLVVDAE